MKVHVTYCMILFVHFCFGNIYAKEVSEIKMNMVRYALSQDSLSLRMGIDFIERKEYDSARVYLLRSAESAEIPIKTESYLYLNFIETRLQNYDVALLYLELYHKNAMLLFHRSLEIEDSIRNHKESIDHMVSSLDRHNRIRLHVVIFLSVMLLSVVFLLIYLQYKGLSIFSKRKKKELDQLNETILSRKDVHQSLCYNAYLIQSEIFKETQIYKEIKVLEKQDRTRDVKVLTYEKQAQLQREFDRYFENFQRDLHGMDVKLSENDIKLCCLSLLPVSSFGKALCFGSTEINVIKQRKYYLKKKMTEDSDNKLLFDFIFSVRKE